jgi:tetratricopeptide (TPR) repeat protein
LGGVLASLGQYHESAVHFEAALQFNPDWIYTLKCYAWVLATCPHSSIRDGPRAVKFARHSCELTHYQKPVFVEVLGAAYAEAGQYDQALAMSKKATKLAEEDGETNLIGQNLQLMKLYAAHKAYREQPNDPLSQNLP